MKCLTCCSMWFGRRASSSTCRFGATQRQSTCRSTSSRRSTLHGTIAYVRDHEAVINLVQAGKIDLKPFITGRIALEDLVSEGSWTLIDRNDTAVKTLVHP
jgi:threonine dehydrogenase-like Zn-dependent dehydrogenase